MAIGMGLVLAACTATRTPDPRTTSSRAACEAAFELWTRSPAKSEGEPPVVLLEGRGICEGVPEQIAPKLQSEGVDAWPWSDAFGAEHPRCPSPRCGPHGGAVRVTVDVWSLPGSCRSSDGAGPSARDDERGISVVVRAGRVARLATACASTNTCERARVRVLESTGGHAATYFLSCEGGRYVAREDFGAGAVMY